MADEQEQKKSERLHMLISPAELEAIDDWRFKNRIGTRAEAVRRLTQTALDIEEPFEKFSQRIHKMYAELMSRMNVIMTGPLKKDPPDNDMAFRMVFLNHSDLLKEFAPLAVEVHAVQEQLAKMRGQGDVPELATQTAAIKAEAAERARMLKMALKAVEKNRLDLGDEDDEE